MFTRHSCGDTAEDIHSLRKPKHWVSTGFPLLTLDEAWFCFREGQAQKRREQRNSDLVSRAMKERQHRGGKRAEDTFEGP